jgi:hypothetical protein
MSFQDIIYNNYQQWQVGYSGTTSLELNKYVSTEPYVFREIIEDFDEKIEVLLALNSTKKMRRNVIDIINSTDNSVISTTTDLITQITDFLNLNSYKGISRGFIDLIGILIVSE